MLNIIYVDDNQLVLDLISEIIKLNCPDVKLQTYNRSTEAKTAIEQASGMIDIVMTDINMPTVDGFEIIQTCIGRIDIVIMLTGNQQNLTTAEQRFADKIQLIGLNKPVLLSQLTGAISEAKTFLQKKKASIPWES